MIDQQILAKYRKDVDQIRKSAKSLGLNDKEVNELFKESLRDLRNEIHGSNQTSKQRTKAQKCIRTFIFISILYMIFITFIYVLLRVHQPTYSIVLRNVQGLTHPVLKFVRMLAVPVIKLFPSLTDLYEESCLIENPYFYVSEMECWPCENVNTVVDITENKELFKSGAGTPFVAKIDQEKVTLKTLEELYAANKAVLGPEAHKIKSSTRQIHHLKDLFANGIPSEAHVTWRLNKMNPGRVIRQVFKRPQFLPDRVGQSVERFLLIDGPAAVPYELPNTECGYVFVLQGSGERTVVLKPSRECSKKCKTVSVVLRESHVCKYRVTSRLRVVDGQTLYM
ncbi:unnamed protein product [Acanthoscelides obtectus]|uniref:Uncharacterized protein n=1 Tax=Acanthoscelides obtectus TaxID=200917 RepID=A0A9P0L903_ACAOB|nr:unnamed protein product [Acanthoscelides obtectus]CAK1626914.1 hypothetical protein AOBTE_LOCUS4147 [Acanthoscelides obtectus]